MTAQPRPFGVYVHVPFCSERCDYCAFATWTDRDHLFSAYTEACVAHLRGLDDAGVLAPATSVFFGGGTPSRLPASMLCEIAAAIPSTPDCEITVECNPEDVTEQLVDTYRGGGITRVSVGIQSTSPLVLQALGRRHGTDALERTAAVIAAAGFESWNVDLIFGARGERASDWQRTLDAVLALDSPPPHISAYALTPEPGTPLGVDRRRHPDDDICAERYEQAARTLEPAGYGFEEISNWALRGHSCVHNNLYWSGGDYEAIGPAAHGHRSGRRYWNIRTPERYIAAISTGSSPIAGEEILDERTRRFELAALQLRTAGGVDASLLPKRDELDGLVTYAKGRAVLTVRGRLLANAITSYLEVD